MNNDLKRQEEMGLMYATRTQEVWLWSAMSRVQISLYILNTGSGNVSQYTWTSQSKVYILRLILLLKLLYAWTHVCTVHNWTTEGNIKAGDNCAGLHPHSRVVVPCLEILTPMNTWLGRGPNPWNIILRFWTENYSTELLLFIIS